MSVFCLAPPICMFQTEPDLPPGALDEEAPGLEPPALAGAGAADFGAAGAGPDEDDFLFA